ncbi:hypothetical protein D3C86_1367450 [compost metagenome]
MVVVLSFCMVEPLLIVPLLIVPLPPGWVAEGRVPRCVLGPSGAGGALGFGTFGETGACPPPWAMAGIAISALRARAVAVSVRFMSVSPRLCPHGTSTIFGTTAGHLGAMPETHVGHRLLGRRAGAGFCTFYIGM